MMAHRAEIAYIKGLRKEMILAKPNVVGVGIGYKTVGLDQTKDLCLIAMVDRKIPRAGLSELALIPKQIDGVLTDVIQVGTLRAMQSRTDRWRPVPGGVSLGHYQVTAGTLGCVVRDCNSRDRLFLSNNHVLANSNLAKIGDPILQPGPADGGRDETDIIAALERFVPIAFTQEPGTCEIALGLAEVLNRVARVLGSGHRMDVTQYDPLAMNQVDAALARPVGGMEISDEILDIGVVGGTTPARLGMRVRKSGRSTGFTTGQILVLDATLKIQYGDRNATFDDQIVTTAMSAPGDSGSLLVAADALLAVGLLFAGSEQATIYNPIKKVLDALKVVL